MKTPEQLADEHWSWLHPVLELTGVVEIELIKYLFTTAMIHGYKHGSAYPEKSCNQ